MRSCIVIGASPQAVLPPDLHVGDSMIICADGGYDRAMEWNLRPHVVIGDFDSAQSVPRGDFEVVSLPREKDDTDLLAAVKLALSRGCTRFRILGALGGRFDHGYGNLSVLQFIAEQGGTATLEDGSTTVVLRRAGDPPLLLESQQGKTVSVFPFGAPRCVATYTGLQYPLTHGELTITVPLGVSNVVVEERASILIESGTAIIMVLKA